MTFYAFRLLSPVVQLLWVIHHGTYLAQRWDHGRCFFIEVDIDDGRGQTVVLRTFVGSVTLEDLI
jgi:hypothetical protein